MNLAHEFKKEDRQIYLYEYSCHECGRSDRGLELHHIYAREKHKQYLSSLFNSRLLCKKCHDNIRHTKEERERFVLATMKFLKEQNYKPKQIDIDFLKENNLIHLIEKL